MLELSLAVASAWLCYAAFALMALCQERHWGDVTGMPCDTRRPVRGVLALAALLLAVSFGLSCLSQGGAFGSLLWSVLISAAATAVAFTLSWRPAGLLPLAALIRRRQPGAAPSNRRW